MNTSARTLTHLLAGLLLGSLALTACGGDDSSGTVGSGSGTTITVLAAASLTGTFTTLAQQFEDEHDGVTVTLAFDSSATLAQQALDGAPADVLATADTATMDSATDALAADPQVFATNTGVLVTPADNPAGIEQFADLDGTADGAVDYVVCVDTAPCGKVAAALLEQDGITQPPVSQEVDVKAVLAKVTSGEADAGLVYATDAVAAGDAVDTVEIPGASDQITTYPIAPLQQSGEADLAQAFVDLVVSDAGQQVLTDAGFGQP